MYIYLVVIFAILSWEVYGFDQGWTVWLPSTLTSNLVRCMRNLSFHMGVYVARIMSIDFYLNFLEPYVRPYVRAIRRILDAISLDAIPGWHFVRGLYAEHYGVTATVVLSMVFLGLYNWYPDLWTYYIAIMWGWILDYYVLCSVVLGLYVLQIMYSIISCCTQRNANQVESDESNESNQVESVEETPLVKRYKKQLASNRRSSRLADTGEL